MAGRLVNEGSNAALCLLLGIVQCTWVGLVAGTLVSRLMLPPFIVTLGLLWIVTAATRLFAQGGSFPVTDDLLGWTGNSLIVGGTGITYGMIISRAVAMARSPLASLQHSRWLSASFS